MVMVAFTIEQAKVKKLAWLGVKDSKLLSPLVREELFERLHELAHDFRVEVVEPDAIDAAENLNWLEAETSARMVSELRPDEIYVDCPSRNIAAYEEYFADKLSKGVRDTAKLVVQHKADVDHLVVGAASIIAKVIRDRWIERLKQEIGIDFGSGYGSDPKTQAFLKDHYAEYAHLFRQSWKPFKNRVEQGKQKSLDEF